MILVKGGRIVNEGRVFDGYVAVDGDRIAAVGEGEYPHEFHGETIDAAGMLVMPGVIDDQVHFREPGLTEKGDIFTESRAAVAGGVTSYMEMPNTRPPTVSRELWEMKYEIAAQRSAANHAFYFGATNDNIREISQLDPKRTCGVKLFMGSSTGNMLVDDQKTLSAIFAESPVTVAAHCESEPLIREAAERLLKQYGDNATAAIHPLVRSAEACYRSTAQAVELADRYGSRLHVLHLSTARELTLFDDKPIEGKKITNEVCFHHLWFSDKDYRGRGNLIKWNPAIKTAADREALREGLFNGRVDVVATDHAPHLLSEKLRPYWQAPSGGPMVQHSLAGMLELFPAEKVVEKMCHAPAVRFGVRGRGFLRAGYYADMVIVDPASPWRVAKDNILYKCGWSPLEGTTLASKVIYTIINGKKVYVRGQIDSSFRGMALDFG